MAVTSCNFSIIALLELIISGAQMLDTKFGKTTTKSSYFKKIIKKKPYKRRAQKTLSCLYRRSTWSFGFIENY